MAVARHLLVSLGGLRLVLGLGSVLLGLVLQNSRLLGWLKDSD